MSKVGGINKQSNKNGGNMEDYYKQNANQNARKPILLNDQEQLQQENERLQQENEQLRDQLRISKMLSVIDARLVRLGARNPTAVRSLLQIENITIDDQGNLEGLDEQIEKLRTEEGYLFYPQRHQQMYGMSPEEARDEPELDLFARGFLNIG